MGRNRLSLHEKLCKLLGSRNCYFCPPVNIQMQYPCIVYEYNGINVQNADDKRYLKHKRYTLTVIDHDSDSLIVDRLIDSDFKHLQQNNTYESDGLNHFVFTLYY